MLLILSLWHLFCHDGLTANKITNPNPVIRTSEPETVGWGWRQTQARSVFCLRNKNGTISKSAESFANKIYFYCLRQNSNHYLDNLWVTISVNRLEIGLLNTEQENSEFNKQFCTRYDSYLLSQCPQLCMYGSWFMLIYFLHQTNTSPVYWYWALPHHTTSQLGLITCHFVRFNFYLTFIKLSD